MSHKKKKPSKQKLVGQKVDLLFFHIHLAEQVKDFCFIVLIAHCKVDVRHGPHLAVHIAAAPCPVLIDSVDGDALLHTARHLAAAVGSLGGRILT